MSATYDADYSSVSVLLHFEGTDASTTFTDSAPTPNTFTAQGNAQIDTAQKVFGTASGLFDGTGDYLTAPDATSLRMGAGSFTIEARVRFAALPAGGGGVDIIMSKGRGGDSNLELQAQIIESGGSYYMRTATSTDGINAVNYDSSAITIATNTWYAFSWVRDGSTLRFFQDGAAKGTQTFSGTLFGGAGNLSIGAAPTGGGPLNGWIDELRITKAVARYTGAYTPEAEEFPYQITTAVGATTFAGLTATIAETTAGRLSTAILADSPVAYWKLTEASGTLANSATTGSNYDLTVGTGTATYQQAALSDNDYDYSLKFSDGGGNPSARLENANGSSANDPATSLIGATGVSLEFLVNRPSTGLSTHTNFFYGEIAHVGGTAGDELYMSATWDDTTKLSFYGVSGAEANGTIGEITVDPGANFLGTAHHVCGVLDFTNKTSRIYVDGSLIAEQSQAFVNNTLAGEAKSGDNTYIGGPIGGSTGAVGTMAHVALYAVPLTTAQVQAHALASRYALRQMELKRNITPQVLQSAVTAASISSIVHTNR